MKKENINYTKINYASSSVDVTLESRNYLLEHNFLENNQETNISLLERSLINYSILKLVEWNVDIEKLNLEEIDNLDYLLKTLSSEIPSSKEREEFFAQYTHCIIYIVSNIVRRNPIVWESNTDSEIEFKLDKNTLTTNKKIESYQIPLMLINKIKENYNTKKNPVMIKYEVVK